MAKFGEAKFGEAKFLEDKFGEAKFGEAKFGEAKFGEANLGRLAGWLAGNGYWIDFLTQIKEIYSTRPQILIFHNIFLFGLRMTVVR